MVAGGAPGRRRAVREIVAEHPRSRLLRTWYAVVRSIAARPSSIVVRMPAGAGRRNCGQLNRSLTISGHTPHMQPVPHSKVIAHKRIVEGSRSASASAPWVAVDPCARRQVVANALRASVAQPDGGVTPTVQRAG
jgi:hypothetical protein